MEEHPKNGSNPRLGRALASLDAPSLALGLLLIVTSVLRFTVSPDRPLWLDEVWTGMIVSQRSFADFAHQCALDINAPLYYVLAAVWAAVSGISNPALRFLPAMLGVAAPLIPLGAGKFVDRPTRFTWCALLACWIPGVWYSQEARPYTLTFAMGIANALAFAAVLRRPTQRTAWIWTSVSSLLVLAHYYGAVLVALQGALYLIIHRRRAVATWLAALALIPAAAAIAMHARELVAFATPGISWISPHRPGDLFWDAGFILGSLVLVVALPLWTVIAIVLRFRMSGRGEAPARPDDLSLWAAAACALAAAVVAVGIGFVRPMLVVRYLTAFVPGILLGVALVANRMAPGWRLGPAALAAMFLATLIQWSLQRQVGENAFNFEVASNWLMKDRPRRLVFLWDTPLGQGSSAFSGAGGFFFARAGRPVIVDAVGIANGQDPNRVLLAHAAQPGSAIIWFYDLRVQGTAAIQFPPAIASLDPRWRCRNFAGGRIGVIACDQA